jgi:hypothetical protein
MNHLKGVVSSITFSATVKSGEGHHTDFACLRDGQMQQQPHYLLRFLYATTLLQLPQRQATAAVLMEERLERFSLRQVTQVVCSGGCTQMENENPYSPYLESERVLLSSLHVDFEEIQIWSTLNCNHHHIIVS